MNEHSCSMDRKEHEVDAKITNLIWEVAKIVNPDTYIEPEIILKAKIVVVNMLKIKE